MKLSLPPETQEMIDSRVRAGRYSSPEDVVVAALSQLDQQEQIGEFEAGELDHLLAEGEASGQALDGDQVLAEMRQLRDRLPGG